MKLDTNENLFIELNDSQQEIVSGGGQLLDFDEDVLTSYQASLTKYGSMQSSGPNGSTNAQYLTNAYIDTSVSKEFEASFS